MLNQKRKSRPLTFLGCLSRVLVGIAGMALAIGILVMLVQSLFSPRAQPISFCKYQISPATVVGKLTIEQNDGYIARGLSNGEGYSFRGKATFTCDAEGHLLKLDITFNQTDQFGQVMIGERSGSLSIQAATSPVGTGVDYRAFRFPQEEYAGLWFGEQGAGNNASVGSFTLIDDQAASGYFVISFAQQNIGGPEHAFPGMEIDREEPFVQGEVFFEFPAE